MHSYAPKNKYFALIFVCLFVISCVEQGGDLYDRQPHPGVEQEQKKTERRGAKTVIFVGDSVLDNCNWVGGAAHDVGSQLEAIVDDMEVQNLAVDSATTAGVLNGMAAFGGRIRCTQAHQGAPIKRLQEIQTRPKHEIEAAHFVLSVGGNDMRVAVGPGSTQTLINASENYKKIVVTLASANPSPPRLILVLPYIPGNVPGQAYAYKGLGEKQLTDLFRQWTRDTLYEEARRLGLPVIDLANTFPPRDLSYYVGSDGFIEPSVKGGKAIAFLIKKVIEDFDFQKGRSMNYYLGRDDLDLSKNTFKKEALLLTGWAYKWGSF